MSPEIEIPARHAEFMALAVSEAEASDSEDQRAHPKVGAVAVRGDEVLATAHRGETGPGDHAEYVLLGKKLKGDSLAGATIYTTLEPCTHRSDPKIACADRLATSGVSRVVIGMLDPNPEIRGKGVLRLREAPIAVEFFGDRFMTEIEELNRDFIRTQQRADAGLPLADEDLMSKLQSRSLQDWYRTLNGIYWNRNFHLSSAHLLSHLVEVVGGLSSIASGKRKPGVDPNAFVAKAIAWWLALSGKLGISSVENMVWGKFPDRCAYCHAQPCLSEACAERKAREPGPNWERLAELGDEGERPTSLGAWQRMFGSIYPAGQVSDLGRVFGRLAEELGELSEAVRIFRAEPGYYLSEASDVFAWLMQIQNHLDKDAGVALSERGENLERAMAKAYPEGCRDCGRRTCSCPPILASTIGRIAHEVPPARSSQAFISPDAARLLFLRDSEERLLELKAVVDLVTGVLREEPARLWLRTPNPDLGYEKPLDVVAKGEYQRVIDSIMALAEGVTA